MFQVVGSSFAFWRQARQHVSDVLCERYNINMFDLQRVRYAMTINETSIPTIANVSTMNTHVYATWIVLSFVVGFGEIAWPSWACYILHVSFSKFWGGLLHRKEHMYCVSIRSTVYHTVMPD
jgi:hypothetical protein